MNNNRVNLKQNSTNNLPFPYVKVNILYVSIFILLCVIGYFVYSYLNIKYEQTSKSYIQNEVLIRRNGKENKIIPSSNTPVSLYGNEYNISLWIKVLNYNYRYGAPKYILRKGDLEIYLNNTKNNLHIRISKNSNQETPSGPECDEPENCELAPIETTTTQDDTTTTQDEPFTNGLNKLSKCIANTNICDNKVDYKHNELLDTVLKQYKKVERFETTTTPQTTNHIEFDECIQFDFPLQKWTHLSMNFFSNNIDIYVDGKLSSSCKLDIIPNINVNNLNIVPDGGFDGEVAKVTYSNAKLSSRNIYDLYKASPL